MITFTQIRVFSPLVFRNLAVSPLVVSNPRADDYSTLDEALTTGRVRITEVGEAGSVPELKLLNDTDHPILLLDGEELTGAKQNRICNLTILAPRAPKPSFRCHAWRLGVGPGGRRPSRHQATSTLPAAAHARLATFRISLSTLRAPCETGFGLERHLQQTRPAGHAIGHGSHVRCLCPAQRRAGRLCRRAAASPSGGRRRILA